MVVQHNLTAMNSNRMLGITTRIQAKSTEKLSSGYKINRAADDAAGLSISEKMRKQIRGLSQASLNAQDGISAVQTAEGALNEVQDMLQRMNELAVKAANGTNSEDDKKYIQDEIDQLIDEIDRVSETTKFNETYLLKGDPEATTSTFKAEYTTPLASEVKVKTGQSAFAVEGTTALDDTNVGNYVEIDENGALKYKEGVVLYKKAGTPTTAVGDQVSAEKIAEADLGTYFEISSNGIYKDAAMTQVATDEDIAAAVDTATGEYTGTFYAKKAAGDTAGTEIGADYISTYITVTEEKTADPLKLSLHVGADSTQENKIELDIQSMSAKSLGVNEVKVTGVDSSNADAAIDTIAEAIQKVSTQRSALGAVQNRLEHTINNLDNVVENTTSAESQIRDTDMATEMVKYSNNQILAQAGQAMLAQSNQANQGVLSLLQ